jgi:hypothetical protein
MGLCCSKRFSFKKVPKESNPTAPSDVKQKGNKSPRSTSPQSSSKNTDQLVNTGPLVCDNADEQQHSSKRKDSNISFLAQIQNKLSGSTGFLGIRSMGSLAEVPAPEISQNWQDY